VRDIDFIGLYNVKRNPRRERFYIDLADPMKARRELERMHTSAAAKRANKKQLKRPR
jgi:hypothetical protein